MKPAPILLISLVLIFTSCLSPSKLVEIGDYDKAIDVCVQRLSGKKNKKADVVKALESAFDKATRQDMRIAESLEKDGRPENWERINEIHRGIGRRQAKIEPLLPLMDQNGYQAKFQFVRIEDLERKSRENAAEYFYNHAITLLDQAKKGDKQAARDAYGELQQLDRYYRDYKNRNQLELEALDLGAIHILIKPENASNSVLPKNFEQELMQFSTADMETVWKKYYNNPLSRNAFDYIILVKMVNIAVSPESVKEREYVDYKEIEEGWEYVLDGNGNVLKDSLGNDVKIPKKIFITANVLEVYQNKVATVSGRIEFIERRTGNILANENITADAIFENYASTYKGDKRALSDDTKRRLGNSPMPFPPNEVLLLQAASILKPVVKQKIASSPYLR
ncbi:MAG: hypothetical protein IPL49_15215 [Saprospirales bacterium]|nr:hypothetical protein [Saprospirales bacterium]MBK8492186.1 hypothetical protein [Saprospirales bacterium]